MGDHRDPVGDRGMLSCHSHYPGRPHETNVTGRGYLQWKSCRSRHGVEIDAPDAVERDAGQIRTKRVGYGGLEEGRVRPDLANRSLDLLGQLDSLFVIDGGLSLLAECDESFGFRTGVRRPAGACTDRAPR